MAVEIVRDDTEVQDGVPKPFQRRPQTGTIRIPNSTPAIPLDLVVGGLEVQELVPRAEDGDDGFLVHLHGRPPDEGERADLAAVRVDDGAFLEDKVALFGVGAGFADVLAWVELREGFDFVLLFLDIIS